MPRVPAEAHTTRDDDAVFRDELDKVWMRLRAVAESNPADFVDGSIGFDHATVAVLRIAAMAEASSRFAGRFSGMHEESRRGLVATRNILSRSGYEVLDLAVFWQTVTVSIPAELKRLGLDPGPEA